MEKPASADNLASILETGEMLTDETSGVTRFLGRVANLEPVQKAASRARGIFARYKLPRLSDARDYDLYALYVVNSDSIDAQHVVLSEDGMPVAGSELPSSSRNADTISLMVEGVDPRADEVSVREFDPSRLHSFHEPLFDGTENQVQPLFD